MASVSPPGTMNPSSPCVMMLRGPWLASVLTTGRPAAIASTITLPNASRLEGSTKIEPLLNSGETGAAGPISVTVLCRPRLSICLRRLAFSVPPP